MHPERKVYTRISYGFINMIGDLGGIIDGLYYATAFIFLSWAKFNFFREATEVLFTAVSKDKIGLEL